MLPRSITFAVGLAAPVLALCAAPALAAAPRSAPPGMVAPHALPGAGAAAAKAEPASWLVGTRLEPDTRTLASRYGARLLSPRGTFVVPRGQARAFAGALKRRGAYRFSEPDVRVRRLQEPPAAPYDEFAATDWRGFLLGPTLVAPSPATAPLTAVIDSAVDPTHPDLLGVKVIGDPTVSDAHGTAVASLITGQANGVGMVGVFPGTPLLSIGSSLATSDLIRAISTAVENKAKVINMSWGGPSPTFAMFVEIASAVSQGVLPVAAAGNDYDTALPDGTTNPVVFPAAFPHVLSVSAIGPSGKSSDFSTSNGAVDLAAPGESVLTAVPVALDTDGVADGYARLDGTSFASPIVAGVAAWLMTARPELSGREVGDVLRYSATDVGDKGYDSDTGYGMVNLAAALGAPRPASDGIEVNDDIEWTNGKRFDQPDPYLYRGFTRRGTATGAVDTFKDPADVFRIQMPRRSRFKVTLRTARGADPDLAVYNSRATSIYKRRGLVDVSAKGKSKTETLTFRNSSSAKATAYAVVYAPSTKADRYDAPYELTVEKR